MDDTKKGLTGNQLKGIALCSMTLDHIICVLFPQYPTDWWILLCQTLGRIAAPIFWYMVAEGYRHTHDLRRYLARLFIFAVIGHFAYNFAFGIPFVPFRTSVFNQTSVIWPLFIGVVALWACDREQLAAWQKSAVMESIRRGILPEYLERKAAEVINMLTMEYNYADDVAAQKEESFEEGRDEGMRLGEEKGRDEGRVETIRLMMGNMNLTFAQVMDALKIEPSERDRLASLLS